MEICLVHRSGNKRYSTVRIICPASKEKKKTHAYEKRPGKRDVFSLLLLTYLQGDHGLAGVTHKKQKTHAYEQRLGKETYSHYYWLICRATKVRLGVQSTKKRRMHTKSDKEKRLILTTTDIFTGDQSLAWGTYEKKKTHANDIRFGKEAYFHFCHICRATKVWLGVHVPKKWRMHTKWDM